MIELTDDFLKLKPGAICYWPATLDHPVAGTWHITIPLEPFSADDEYEPASFRPDNRGPELIKTEIALDHIHLQATELAGLSQRTFTFPVNPEDGYIDGSIYLVASHCPVDVTRIEFGQATSNHIPATLQAHFDFDAAGAIDIQNRTAELKTVLHFELGRPVT
ncbi:hypothetical protein [Actinomadura sp. 7K534]|uniref:hypothetical protein n=1 Tax=Actinomadura sp. 7K534 TaxID=2530366 RepID=UPI0010500C4F|nr:hypothetical protein [Actinomadura sp. 7K534]TDB85792.1 hypothetical protein E1266_35070 [Actinomadura sp. 7K534]